MASDSPTPPASPSADTRRGFLFKLGIAINAVAATLFALPIVGYILSPVRRRAWQEWIRLGPVEDFPVQQTRLATFENPFTVPWDGMTASLPCWVRRIDDSTFQVFAINCTHLGCPVRWFPESSLFMCPCHGGVYYENGDRASGPPPRGLYQYKYKVEQGQLWIWGGQLPTLSQPA